MELIYFYSTDTNSIVCSMHMHHTYKMAISLEYMLKSRSIKYFVTFYFASGWNTWLTQLSSTKKKQQQHRITKKKWSRFDFYMKAAAFDCAAHTHTNTHVPRFDRMKPKRKTKNQSKTNVNVLCTERATTSNSKNNNNKSTYTKRERKKLWREREIYIFHLNTSFLKCLSMESVQIIYEYIVVCIRESVYSYKWNILVTKPRLWYVD